MKKYILVLITLIFCSNLVFSLDNNSFKNNKNIEYLYVNSPEGLRIRNKPALSGNKIGVLYDRMKLKILEIGAEETIDGITSNWIRVLLPVESLKQKKTVSGWVFGGYLTDVLKPFSTKDWTDRDLILYLSRFEWWNGYRFTQDGKCFWALKESGAGASGTYSVSIKNKTVDLTLVYGDDTGEWEETRTKHFDIKTIHEDKIVFSNDEMFEPDFFKFSDYYYDLTIEENYALKYWESGFYVLCYDFGQKMLKEFIKDKDPNDIFYRNLKLMGIEL